MLLSSNQLLRRNAADQQPAQTVPLPTHEALRHDLDELMHGLLKASTASIFATCPEAPDYRAFLGSESKGPFFAHIKKYQDYLVSKEGSFIQAARLEAHRHGDYAGDKFHISVEPSALERTFNLLSAVLFSPDSPIDRWKMSDPRKVPPGSRTHVGAQITLYAKPRQESSRYELADLMLTRQYIEHLEALLASDCITHGRVPDSDVQAPHWAYTSYRNDQRGERFLDSANAIEVNQRKMNDEPFFQLMSQPYIQ